MNSSLPATSRRFVASLATCVRVFLALAVSGPWFAAGAAEPAGAFWFADLAPFALSANEPVTRQLAALPKGSVTFHAVPFHAAAPVAVTGMESARIGDFFPPSITGIKVGRTARRIHLLHGTLFAEKDGTPLAKLVIHYADGREESVRLGYGVHARSWIIPRLEKRAEVFHGGSALAWTEADGRRGSGLRLFQTAIENPRPGEVVASLDIVSLFSHAAPFIAALTVEGADSKLPPSRSIATRKAVRDLGAFPDAVYRGELSVRVTDGESGAASTNAVVSLAITDDKESYFLGSTPVDAQGQARLPYPPLHSVGVSLWVHAPGRMPVVVAESKTNVAKFSGNYAVRLKRGTTIGGMVKDAQGREIIGAQVIIYQATRLSPHHYSRTDYDVAKTGADGKWTSDCLPADLSGLGFQVSHADYRPAFYTTEGFAPPPTNSSSTASSSTTSTATSFRRLPDGTMEPITTRRGTVGARGPTMPLLATNALRDGTAAMVLQDAILLQGTLADTGSKPVPQAEVIVQRPSGARLFLRTDAQGKFQTRLTEPGDATVFVLRDGFSPFAQFVDVKTGLAPLEIKLAAARVLHGRVQDQKQRPIPGARVRLDEWNDTTDLLKFQTLTDGQGTFTWTGAPTDRVTFYVTKTNFSNARHSFGGTMDNIAINLSRPPGVYGKVYDAETKKPVESFFVFPGRKYSSNEKQIHWERSEGLRGFGGEYSLRMSSYYFQPEGRVMIEAPGYEPQISPAFNSSDSYPHDFALKKGRGVGGVVQLADGSPVTGASLLLVEKGEGGMLDTGGQLRGNGGGSDVTRSDARGRFEFTPKLEPDRVFVSHEQGFASVRAADVTKAGKIVLEKWAQVKGVMRVGDQGATDAAVRLQSNDEYVVDGDNEGRSARFYFVLKSDPDAGGNFTFDKVPPGDHRLSVEYKFKDERYGEAALSHGFLISAKPGETVSTTLGGTGRRVTGRVQLAGGDHSDVDWKRDVHRLNLVPPNAGGSRVINRANAENPLVFLGGLFNGATPAQPVSVEAMREMQRAQRSYVLLVETNGSFRVDHVPPGKYQLMLNVTDPDDEYYNRRTIGALSHEITVPDEKAATVNAPFDIGEVPLTIRPRVRIGKVAPSFDAKTADGKTIKLSAFNGRPALLYFWGMSIGYNTYDFTVLRELQNNYGAGGKLAVISYNLDADAKNADQFAKQQNFNWTQAYLGQWNQTPVPGMFGFNGNSGAVIIDAEGRVASGILRSSNIRTAVNNLMSGE